MITINNNLPSKLLSIPSGLEILIVEVQCKITLTFCVVYIPPNPNSSYHCELLAFLNNYASKPHTFISSLETLTTQTSTGTLL